MTKAKHFIVKNKFQNFLPELTDFDLEETVLPTELEENQFLVKAEYISVDPYMRSFASKKKVPYPQFAFQVGQVRDSKNDNFPDYSYVVSHSTWSSHVILDEKKDSIFGIAPYAPPVEGLLHRSLALGALGMPGITGYLGVIEVLRPKPGDIVCITSAAGAVGSIAGQIAKLRDCVVIGIAGSDEKVDFLTKELGFHAAFNYKTESHLEEQLKKVAPRGIDCFFDNVGGPLADQITERVAVGGKIANCGSISTYGENTPHRNIRKKASITSIPKEVEEISFSLWDLEKRQNAMYQLKTLIENNHIKAKETITNHFDNLPEAFIGMLRGDGIGKCLVKV